MVQHRSGIPNLTDTPNFWIDQPKSDKEALKLFVDLPANFEPDKEYGYSNTNYLLISEIIDKVVGYSHHQYIKEEILIPLDLNNTFSSIREVNIDDEWLLRWHRARYKDSGLWINGCYSSGCWHILAGIKRWLIV